MQVLGSSFGSSSIVLVVNAAVALTLAVITSGVLVLQFRRNRIWFLLPILALGWFIVIFAGIQISVHYFGADPRRW